LGASAGVRQGAGLDDCPELRLLDVGAEKSAGLAPDVQEPGEQALLLQLLAQPV